MRNTVEPSDFKLSTEHEHLLDMYLQKLRNHLKTIIQKDETSIRVETDFMKRMLSEKE